MAIVSADVPCGVDGCDDLRYCRGLCRGHYLRWLRTGSPIRQPRATHAEVATRAVADAVVLLIAKGIIKTASPESVATTVKVTIDDLREAVTRHKGHVPGLEPIAKRHGRNRDLPMTLKWCPQCEQVLSVEQFSRHRYNPDGRQGWCSRCVRAKHAEKRRAEKDGDG